VAFAFSLVACVSPADSRTGPEAAKEEKVEIVEVTVAPVIARPAQRPLKFVGTLYGAEEVTLSSQVEGQIRAVHADLGDRVEAGQILADIEDDQLKAKLRVLEATLAKARSDEERGQRLVGQKVISPQEYEAMKTSAAVAAAERDQLVVMIEHATVRSPLTGSIAKRLVSGGEYVRPGTPLFEIVADDSLKLRGDVPERFARDLDVGQRVQVAVDAFPATVFSGQLQRISPAANPDTRSITVEAVIENSTRRLKPGFFANASIATRVDEQALFVPEKAVLSFAGVKKVFVVRNEVAHQTPVRTGSHSGDGLVEITEGLFADEIVVTSGFAKLVDGARVSIGSNEGTPASSGRAAEETTG
jgi:membrane fusion protein (multidrug efflux system)